VYFYELHEADDDVFANVLLAHDAEYDEQEFLDLVLEARERVMDRFEEESLIEAVANDLARSHGFIHVERNLRAAVNVSIHPDETAVTPVDELAERMPAEADDFQTMLIEVEPEDRPWREG
jgi:hypothetical protein